MGALKWLRHNFRSSRKPLRAVIISSTKWCVVFLVQSVTCSTISRDCKLAVVDANRCKPGILILWQHASCKCIKCFIEPKASNKASSTRSIASSSSNSTLGLVCNIRMIDLVGMLRMTLKSYVPRMRKRFKCGKPPKSFSVFQLAPLIPSLVSLNTFKLLRKCCNIDTNPLTNLLFVITHIFWYLRPASKSVYPNRGFLVVVVNKSIELRAVSRHHTW